jgi:hypothetical protein
MNNMTKESVDFTIGDEEDLRELLDNISSSHSAEASFEFEYNNDIMAKLYGAEEIKKSRAKRKMIPEEIK